MKNKKFIYNIKKDDNEIYLYYNLRKKFIEMKEPKNTKEMKLYEMYSYIFINMLFLKCRYKEKTENVIYQFLQKHSKNINVKPNMFNL